MSVKDNSTMKVFRKAGRFFFVYWESILRDIWNEEFFKYE